MCSKSASTNASSSCIISEVIRQTADVQITVALMLVLQMHHPDGVGNAAAVHRLQHASFGRSLKQLIEIRKEHLFFLLEMRFQIGERFLDQLL